jgi:acetyl esterase/lipase
MKQCLSFPLGLGLTALGLLLASRPARAEVVQPSKAFAVQEVRNVPYWQARAADPVRHRLDLYLPQGKREFPVVVFVHGGAWMLGDKNFFGWGPDIGTYFASQGIGVVMPSYRLSPAVKHPEHVKDVARAVAWTFGNIRKYGGRADQLFLCGHSAGGHLVALLATDPTYLKAEGLKPSVIKGVIAVSGVYRIGPVKLDLGIPEQAANSALALLRALQTPKTGPTVVKAFAVMPAAAPVKLDMRVNLFGPAFGTDPKVLEQASPLNHVKAGLPPFLLIYADHDLPLLPAMAREFAQRLQEAKCPVQLLKINDRDHEMVMFEATTASDPVARAIQQFLAKYTGKAAKATPRKQP